MVQRVQSAGYPPNNSASTVCRSSMKRPERRAPRSVTALIWCSRWIGSSVVVPSGATKPDAALGVSGSRSLPTATDAVRVLGQGVLLLQVPAACSADGREDHVVDRRVGAVGDRPDPGQLEHLDRESPMSGDAGIERRVRRFKPALIVLLAPRIILPSVPTSSPTADTPAAVCLAVARANTLARLYSSSSVAARPVPGGACGSVLSQSLMKFTAPMPSTAQ